MTQHTHPAFTRAPLAALLLSTAVCGTVAAGFSRAAGIPVVDALMVATVGEQHAETIVRWVEQGTQMARTITQGAQVIQQGAQMIQQGQQLYANLTSPTYLQNYALGLARQQVRAPLPGEPNQVRDALSGVLGFDIQGSFSLSGLANDFIARNVVYRPQGDDTNAVRLREEASSNAARQAIAYQSYDSSARRIEGLQDLSSQIGKGGTTAERMDLQARLTAEQAYTQAQTNQLLAAQMWAKADDDRQRQRQDQVNRKSADDMIDEADRIIASRGRTAAPVGSPTLASLIP